ncbi:hypothetical protein GYMLUDRAFT_246089 [Collybiopsis luxurians FD-317 M1]|uniref:Uncharacterized protein n=1 Tax=Collybiopsis luxurians FD-317 M1 TaxID=944289 RepID=A0A0D0C7A1_9AGAR|nr:hypothetical protein GYMLUDRAFT_246089 [Collybiopsis luxurians FD-317 M1]
MSSGSSKGDNNKQVDDNDDLPPLPEVVAKMTRISGFKEKTAYLPSKWILQNETISFKLSVLNSVQLNSKISLYVKKSGRWKALFAGHGAVALESASTLPTISAAASLVPSICDSDTTLSTAAALSLDSLNPSLPAPFPEPNVAEELALHATAVPSASAPTAGIQQHAPHTQHAKRSIYVSAAFCS